jgi:hypothetical protein
VNVANIASALPVLIQFQDSADDLMPVDPLDNLALSMMLAGVAFIITLYLGRPFINQLKRRGIGSRSASTARGTREQDRYADHGRTADRLRDRGAHHHL